MATILNTFIKARFLYVLNFVLVMAVFILITILFVPAAQAWQEEHQVIMRLTAFPIQVPVENRDAAEDAWWQMREQLTKDQRFFVAMKSYLQQKDVYQARGELKPADVILLSKLLDSHAIMVTFLTERTLKMIVYEGENGRILWEQELRLQPSVPIEDQLSAATTRLTRDFMASVPYQGYVQIDTLRGEPVYREGKHYLLQINVGTADLQIADPVQIVRIFSDQLKPLFTHSANIEVIAEGKVVKKEKDYFIVELVRYNKINLIKEGSLVRLPKELKKVQEQFGVSGSGRYAEPELIDMGLKSAQEEEKEKRPLILSLTFIANLVAILLLAF